MAQTETELRYENTHVHEIYQSIATHFSSTRYKPWPVVEEFLRDRPVGSIGLDIGCGNGKYLDVNRKVFIIASDRHHHPHTSLVADILSLPHPKGSFDFAIAIAVIHHLSSRARRTQALKEILELLRPSLGSDGSSGAGGQALIFVWALEQKSSRRGWDHGDKQDVLVPWVLDRNHTPSFNTSSTSADSESSSGSPITSIYQRYYHLYRQGELREDAIAAGGRIVKEGYDRDNWWAVIARQDCISCDIPTPPM